MPVECAAYLSGEVPIATMPRLQSTEALIDIRVPSRRRAHGWIATEQDTPEVFLPERNRSWENLCKDCLFTSPGKLQQGSILPDHDAQQIYGLDIG